MCQHCEDGTEFVLWSFTTSKDGRAVGKDIAPFSVTYPTIHHLIAARQLTVAAESMRTGDIIHQYNSVNGGEQWLALRDDAAPWVARRTAPNSDGTDPALWAFYCEDEQDARLWVDCGQADTMESATLGPVDVAQMIG